MVYYGVAPPPQVVLVPVFFMLAAAVALGLGLITAALNVGFRDVGYVTPFAMQTLLFLTPVIYPATLLPNSWHLSTRSIRPSGSSAGCGGASSGSPWIR